MIDSRVTPNINTHFPMQAEMLDAGANVPWAGITVSDSSTRLAFLGDLFPIPSGLPGANVLSIDDILIAVGAMVAVAWVDRLHPVEGIADGNLVEAQVLKIEE